MDKLFLFGLLTQSIVIVLHIWRKFTAMHLFMKYRNTEDTRAELKTAYDEVTALIEFARATFLHNAVGSILFILFAAAIDWHLVVAYFSLYALVILPAFRYQFVKHRTCTLFKRIKPTIIF